MNRNILSALMLMLGIILSTSCTSAGNPGDSDRCDAGNGYTLTIHPVKHGSLRMTYGKYEIEVDPCNNIPPKTDYARMPKADLILVTHEHFDHFDLHAIDDLLKDGRDTSTTHIVANKNCFEKIMSEEHHSMDPEALDCISMPNGGTDTTLPGITIEAVPAYNTTKGKEKFHPRGRDNGYVLTLGKLRVYIAGDTEPTPEMMTMKDIDITFLPCNQPYTMTPAQLAQAVRVIRPKVVYPYHFSETPVENIEKALKGCGAEVKIRPVFK